VIVMCAGHQRRVCRQGFGLLQGSSLPLPPSLVFNCGPLALSLASSVYHAYMQQRQKEPRSQFGWICFPDGPNPLVTNPHVLCPCGMQCAHVVCLCAHVVCLPPTTPPTSHASLPHTAHIHAHTRMHTNGCALIGTRKETVNVMTQTLSVDTVSTER